MTFTGANNVKGRHLGAVSGEKPRNLTHYGKIGGSGKNHRIATSHIQSPVAFSRGHRSLNRLHNALDRKIGKNKMVGGRGMR